MEAYNECEHLAAKGDDHLNDMIVVCMNTEKSSNNNNGFPDNTLALHNTKNNIGLVKIAKGGQWHPVCNLQGSFGSVEAKNVCTIMGFDDGELVT